MNFKRIASLILVLSVLPVAGKTVSYADEQERADYLEFSNSYVISDKTPREKFISTYMNGEIITDDDLEPDLTCCCEYLTMCADECGLVEYGTFSITRYPVVLKKFLTDTNEFEKIKDINKAVIGDVVFYNNCPGLVVEDGKVLFVSEDYNLIEKELSNLKGAEAIDIEYPYYEQLAFLYMIKDLGYSRVKAIGILTNIHDESLSDPCIEESSNQMGYGICQWSKYRRLDLEFYCRKENKNIQSIYSQLDFMDYELKQSTRFSDLEYTLNHIETNDEDGAYDVAFIFCQEYENPYDAVNESIERGTTAMLSFYPLYGGVNVK